MIEAPAGKQMAEAVFGLLERSLAPITARLRELELKVDELEREPVKFLGTYTPHKMYAKNSLVVHNGSLWWAAHPTLEPPGSTASWRLCVKAGNLSGTGR